MIGKEDFRYNGIPIFNVGFLDFSMIVESLEANRRIYAKSISKVELRTHFKKTRDLSFGICYEGVVVDFRKYQRR
jgi:hypothetical protein